MTGPTAVPEYERLLDAAAIGRKVTELARAIERDMAGRVSADAPLLVVPILKGAFVFAADLVRALGLPCTIEFARAKSYQGETPGPVALRLPAAEFRGREVLVVDGVYDTGATLGAVLSDLRGGKPAGVRVCCLLRKTRPRESEIPIDYVGFEIEDRFVVGYGMDWGERGRHWPDLRVPVEKKP